MAKMRAIDAAVRILEARRGRHRVRCSRCGDQSAVFRAEEARFDPSHSGAPCRGRLAHGRGIHAGQGRQYRRLHRHVGSGRHRHDHWALFGDRGFDPDPVHHRSGAARAPLQGRLSGRRYRSDRKTRDEMGGHRARTGAGAACLQPGVSCHAFGPSRSGADRSAARRAACRDRIRRRDLRTAAGLQARRHAQDRSRRRSACSTRPNAR